VRADAPTSENKPVPLHIAASLVHQQLWPGAIGDDYGEALDRTALALSHVAEILYVDAQGQLKRLPDAELPLGRFENGARLFRTAGGSLYRSLSMRRGDIAESISILRSARSSSARRGQHSRSEET